MQKEDKVCNITPANRVGSVQEYYFSKKLKEVAEMNAAGKNVINLGVGSPDLPPSEQTIETLCEHARKANEHGYQPYVGIPELREGIRAGQDVVRRRLGPENRDPAAHRLQRRYLAYLAGILESGGMAYWFRTRDIRHIVPSANW